MNFTKQTLKYLMILITFTVAIVFCLFNFATVFSVLKNIFSVLSPFILGLCIAFVVNELLKPLERSWDKLFAFIARKKRNAPKKESKPKPKFLEKLNFKKARADIAKKLKRPICLILSILIVLGIISIILLVVIPQLTETVSDIAVDIPYYLTQTEKWYNQLKGFLGEMGIDTQDIALLNIDFKQLTTTITTFVKEQGTDILNTTINVGSSILTSLLNIFIGFVFAIYFLSTKERIGKQTSRVLSVIIPEKRVSMFNHILQVTSSTFSRFVGGQLTEAVIIGSLCALGMLIFGFPKVGTISLLIGATALIPIFGAFIGTGIGAFLILFESPIKAFWFIIFILVLQQLEGNLIYPKVVGDKLGLPGIWVLVAVTVGGGLFGFAGMLLGVPICSVVYTLVMEYLDKRDAKKEKTEE